MIALDRFKILLSIITVLIFIQTLFYIYKYRKETNITIINSVDFKYGDSIYIIIKKSIQIKAANLAYSIIHKNKIKNKKLMLNFIIPVPNLWITTIYLLLTTITTEYKKNLFLYKKVESLFSNDIYINMHCILRGMNLEKIVSDSINKVPKTIPTLTTHFIKNREGRIIHHYGLTWNGYGLQQTTAVTEVGKLRQEIKRKPTFEKIIERYIAISYIQNPEHYKRFIQHNNLWTNRDIYNRYHKEINEIDKYNDSNLTSIIDQNSENKTQKILKITDLSDKDLFIWNNIKKGIDPKISEIIYEYAMKKNPNFKISDIFEISDEFIKPVKIEDFL